MKKLNKRFQMCHVLFDHMIYVDAMPFSEVPAELWLLEESSLAYANRVGTE